MERYLIDTNVVSDYFAGALSQVGLAFLDTVMDAVPNLSIITQIELLCWNTDAHTEQQVKDFIADSNVFNITYEVIQYCVSIRKSKRIKTPDAIIAATALSHNLTLITRNTKDFKNISKLKLADPYDL